MPDHHTEPRLTSLAHGGGCGCKLAPNVLADILSEMPLSLGHSDLIVDAGKSDDAAVYLINETTTLVATTDFFTPIVDDPHTFGRIAATNALSDIFAMGAKPIFCLAIVGMPIGKIANETRTRPAAAWPRPPARPSRAGIRLTPPSQSTASSPSA